MKKTISILAIFALIMTSLPFIGGYEADAASSYIKALKVTATGSTTTKLTWTKLSTSQQKKVTGIIVYRDGKAIKKLGKSVNTYKDSKLKARTKYTYQVCTYKRIKRTQWYNKKTKKWQTKKPAKKERGRSRTVTVTKYANRSPKKTVTTKAANAKNSSGKTSDSKKSDKTSDKNTSGNETSDDSSGDGQISPWVEEAYKRHTTEDTTTYVTFGGTNVHIGQTWTTSLHDQLAKSSNGTLYFNRSKGFHGEKAVDTYLYNTNTYDPFLAVYVVGGKVTGWSSTSQTLFTYKGTALSRGAETMPEGVMKFHTSGFGVLMAKVGFAGASYASSAADERTIGFHFINAVRVAAGRSILKRSHYLEGVDANGNDMVYTGPGLNADYYHGVTSVTNMRYGAQAWAETMDASGKIAHSGLDKGVLGMENCPIPGAIAQDYQNNGCIRGDIIWLASGKKINPMGENVSVGQGEDMVYSYSDSVLHTSAMLNTNHKSIGLGYCNGAHCQKFSYDESEGW